MTAPPAVVISRNLPPLVGGMERLNSHLIAALAHDFVCHVVGPRGSRDCLPAGTRAHECRGQRPLPFLLEAAARTAVLAGQRLRPAVSVATSGVTAPLARAYARASGAPYAVCVHGLDLVAEHAVYQQAFVPSIRAADLVIANSTYTAGLARERGVDAARLRIVNPGVTWSATVPDGAAFRQRFDLGDRPLLLAVGRLAARKGLVEFIERALPGLCQAHPGLLFVIVGDEARQAIRKEGSVRQRIDAAVTRLGLGESVRLLGALGDADLAGVYAACDVHVFPLVPVAGDVEGFGMVAVEAAAAGLPTVAFAEGGVADAVVEGVTGRLIAGGDYSGFAHAVSALLPLARDPDHRRMCRDAAAAFAWQHYERRVRTVMAELVPGPARIPA